MYTRCTHFCKYIFQFAKKCSYDIVCAYKDRKVCKLFEVIGHIWQAYSVNSVRNMLSNLKSNHIPI